MQPVCSWTHGTIQQPGANVGSCRRVYTMLDCMCYSRSIESQLWLTQNNCRLLCMCMCMCMAKSIERVQDKQLHKVLSEIYTIGKYWCPLDHSDTTAISRQVGHFTVPKIVSISLSFAPSATCSKIVIVNVHRPNVMHSAFLSTSWL